MPQELQPTHPGHLLVIQTAHQRAIADQQRLNAWRASPAGLASLQRSRERLTQYGTSAPGTLSGPTSHSQHDLGMLAPGEHFKPGDCQSTHQGGIGIG